MSERLLGKKNPELLFGWMNLRVSCEGSQGRQADNSQTGWFPADSTETTANQCVLATGNAAVVELKEKEVDGEDIEKEHRGTTLENKVQRRTDQKNS